MAFGEVLDRYPAVASLDGRFSEGDGEMIRKYMEGRRAGPCGVYGRVRAGGLPE